MSSSKEHSLRRKLQGGSGTSQAQVVRGSGQGRKQSSEKLQSRLDGDDIDTSFGYVRIKDGPKRIGWLLNYLPITVPDESGIERSGLDLYFLDRQGGNFKASVFHRPFFYVDVTDDRHILEVSQYLLRKFEGCIVEMVEKEDLDLPNHLAGKKHKFIKISFNTVAELMDCKSVLRPAVLQNQKRENGQAFADMEFEDGAKPEYASNPSEYLVDMREYDVPYSMRVSIDLELRVGAWFEVSPETGSDSCTIVWLKDMLELCDLRILAFDIECEKSPLKFPDASKDRIYMISYMTSGQGYLIINREIVTEDVDDFEYTPLPKFPGPFIVYNEPDEEAMLRKFIGHIKEVRPHVFVTYNGDFFDWPFVENRLKSVANLSLYRELGIKSISGSGGENEYVGRGSVHLDAFAWVQRDSYLPQGNQGLKAVTKYKLGYDPIEVDPEDMLRLAQEQPTHMASYSVSDAVATYYLYTTYVHNFIFSLCTIIPMGPEDVLRKGSGTLCEALLMVEACRNNIICPNKHEDPLESFYNGHLIQSETYIGGHVECLEAGVFRADIPAKFTLIPSALQQLIDNIDRDLTFALETEYDIQRTDVINYDEVRQSIVEKLEMLRDSPLRVEQPAIYHLDVGAMYPNIILTNRLQPSAMVSQHDCAACEFNRAENMCKRPMVWTWRGDYTPASQAEYQSIKRQLIHEKGGQNFASLSEKKQAELIAERLKSYSTRVYKKSKATSIVDRVSTVCMRENSFYVDTVRAFRDRRYDYKLLTKTWKNKKTDAEKKGDVVGRKVAEDKEVLMDSLQLAHKCILNSFYGYVMRKGARWRSMEMAGIVTKTGAELIKQARELVEQVGRPLELDTDGIWCILPASFPQDVKFKTANGGKVSVGYPCAMLNADVHDRYTNHQYQDLATNNNSLDPSRKYLTHSECSIYFELDGPYKAMVLPASPEEGKLLKKKYVVFNFNGTIAELKGFEMKRRGELEIVKAFQSQVFNQFLCGNTLVECYNAVGSIANRWLDVLDSCGCAMDDEELLQLISERKTISKTLEDYGDRKATSLTSAARMADFLGAEMVKDKGLNCNLIISKYPLGAPVADRAIPVTIFSADPAVKRYYLRKWFKEPSFECNDFRDVVDWDYYKSRLCNTIQRIVTIPAGMQNVPNPCPRVEHPIWLVRNLQDSNGLKQMKLTSIFGAISKPKSAVVAKAPQLIAAPASPMKKTSVVDETENDALLGTGTSMILSPAGKTKKPNQQATPESRRKRNLFGTPEGGSDGAPREAIDIEDIAGLSASRRGNPPIAHFKKKPQALDFESEAPIPSQSTPVQAEQNMVVADDAIDEHQQNNGRKPKVVLCRDIETREEFDVWLEARKAAWREKRSARKIHLRALSRAGRFSKSSSGVTGNLYGDVDPEDPARKKPVSVADFVKNAAISAAHGFWQILEFQETEGPGEFIVWAMTNRTQMQRFKVVVPRILYLNSLGQNGNKIAKALQGTIVKKDLPHGRQCSSLYEVRVSERKYVRNEKGLSTILCDSQVEGVYESMTPLWFRAVLKTGCIARLANIPDAKSSQFRLHDLEFINTQAHPYLEPSTSSYRRIYLYHAVDKTRSSGFACLALFIVDGTNVMDSDLLSGRSLIWIANGGFGIDAKPPMQRIYRKYQPDERANVKFSSSFVGTVSDVYRNCNDALLTYVREKHGPTLVVAQGSIDPKSWRRLVPALSEFPLTTIPPNNQDDMFPALGWTLFVAERLVQRYLIFPRWLNDRLQCARHSHVPLCNLGADALTTMIDVTFARQLQHNRHLLWASEAHQPDLGGAETDEHFLWSDPLKEPVVNCAGAYRSICIDLDVYGLAVCAIQHSGVLDAEGLTALTVNTDGNIGNAGSGFDESTLEKAPAQSFSTDASCGRAFALLKAIVTKWLEDVKIRGDPISDSILTALYRYLCGYGDALLHDPLLHRIVYLLMSRLFKKLIGQLRKLGVRIIHAGFSRILIHTGKEDIESATEYIEFIISTISSNELFEYIEISPKSYWEQILWLGPENWGGIVAAGTDEAAEGEHDDAEAVAVHQSGAEERGDGDGDGDGFGRDDDDDDEVEVVATTSKGLPPKWAKSKSSSSSNNNNKALPKSAEYDFLDHLLSPSKPSKEADDYDDGDEAVYGDEDGDGDGGAGYDADAVGNDEAEQQTAESIDETDPKTLVRHKWNLATYFPPAVAAYFHELIGEFMLQYRKRRLQLCLQRDLVLSEQSQFSQIANVPLDDNAIEEAVTGMMKTLVKKKLTSDMIKVVDGLAQVFAHNFDQKQRASESRQTAKDFPIRAGSHLLLTSPALEFVKATTHIMSLDEHLAEEVAALKRLLLTQLRVKEFSDESQFFDPSLSYLLRDVICSYCSTCRDIDLLKDSVMSDPNLDKEDRWRCLHCGNGLNSVHIENRILDDVGKMCTAFVLQDFRCVRTHIVSTRYCTTTSELSMPLAMDITQQALRSQLNVIQRVADFHEFRLLSSVVAEFLAQF